MSVKCSKCHHENPDGTRFCGNCAVPLKSSKEIAVTETIETTKEELTTGSIFADRYQIVEELGRGGMGNVYKVLDVELKESTALKLLKPEIAADEKTIERFRNELKLARKISHKNVCRMYDLSKTRATIFMTMRQYDRSIEEYKKLLEMSPDYYTARFWLAFPYAFKGMHDEAVATIDKAMAVSGGGAPLMWTVKGMIYAIAGKKDEARETLVQMLEQSKKSYIAPWMIAAVHAYLDERDKAFEWIEKAFKERDHWLVYLKVSPVVDILHSDPRFPELLKRMGFNK